MVDNQGRYPLHYLSRHRDNEELVHLLADRWVQGVVGKNNFGKMALQVVNNIKITVTVDPQHPDYPAWEINGIHYILGVH